MLRPLTFGLAILGAISLVIVATPAVRWLTPKPAGLYDPLPGTDTLIVLGAGAQDGLPDLESYWRCVYAVRFYRRGGIRRIVVSGGSSRSGETPVAEAMAAYLKSAGVKPEEIVCESRAQSTRENALFVATLLRTFPHGEVAVVTSDYHLWRARAVFRRAGIVSSSVAVPYVGKLGSSVVQRPSLFLGMTIEAGKYVWYRLRGWV